MSRNVFGAALAVVLLSGTASVYAQSAQPATGAATPNASAPAAGQADAAIKPDSGYPLKNGGTYKPPAQYPASPAADLKVYGRT